MSIVSAWSRSSIALCLEAGDHVDLEFRKVYRVIADTDALRSGMLRIIDASGHDYLYPAGWFLPLKLTKLAKQVLTERDLDLVHLPALCGPNPSK